MYTGEQEVLELLIVKKEATIRELAEHGLMNIDSVRRIIESLRHQGFVELSQSEKVMLVPTEEFESYCIQGMPEYSVFKKAMEGRTVVDLTKEEKMFGLSWARKKGLVEIENGKLVPKKTEQEAEKLNVELLALFKELRQTGASDNKAALEELFRRRLLSTNTMKTVSVKYTGKPIEQLSVGFNVSAKAEDAPLGKAHPLTLFAEKVRRSMSELGFEEMEGSIVESCFWNFDALFQPQDHPARELADTFYLYGEAPLPDKKLVERVKESHEKGWKYSWQEKEAKQTVLRTHTTCLSARYLAAMKDKTPRKYFSIGKVFRNEATNYKHLAEFYQVEGIIAWENATFRDLLGTLKQFYKKLGFEKIRFRPSFFPYTEPSLEVDVFFEPRKQWLELGGAGVFRPEVSIPLAGVYPVLAWGLSLERPLMLMLGIEDIRTFYRNDIDFLKSARVEV
jgi:phenylalanyl-tRNA synthetase alpha chain